MRCRDFKPQNVSDRSKLYNPQFTKYGVSIVLRHRNSSPAAPCVYIYTPTRIQSKKNTSQEEAKAKNAHKSPHPSHLPSPPRIHDLISESSPRSRSLSQKPALSRRLGVLSPSSKFTSLPCHGARSVRPSPALRPSYFYGRQLPRTSRLLRPSATVAFFYSSLSFGSGST